MPKKQNSKTDLVQMKTLAQWLGVSSQTVGNYRKNGMPCAQGTGTRTDPYLFEPAKCIRWYIDLEKAKLEEKYDDEISPIEAAKLRKTSLTADIYELDLALKRNELVPTDFAAKVISDVLGRVRQRLLSFPDKHASHLTNLDDAREVKRLLIQFLKNSIMVELREHEWDEDWKQSSATS
jgi:phage terminase Nu1 subunit (DNA packaging protein)